MDETTGKLLDQLRMCEQKSLEKLSKIRSMQQYMFSRSHMLRKVLETTARYVPLSPEENAIRIALGITLEDWALYSLNN